MVGCIEKQRANGGNSYSVSKVLALAFDLKSYLIGKYLNR
jgi:hypothetical protein